METLTAPILRWTAWLRAAIKRCDETNIGFVGWSDQEFCRSEPNYWNDLRVGGNEKRILGRDW